MAVGRWRENPRHDRGAAPQDLSRRAEKSVPDTRTVVVENGVGWWAA